MEEAVCRTCWRTAAESKLFNQPRPFFRCGRCRAFFHLKCDTAASNLVGSGRGLLIGTEILLKHQRHNWCHSCQRLENKLNKLILSYSNTIGTAALLKESFLVMFSKLGRINIGCEHSANILRTLRAKVNNGDYQIPDQFNSDLMHYCEQEYRKVRDKSQFISRLKGIVKSFRHELTEMENCYDCYINRNDSFTKFLEPCTHPHYLLWALYNDIYFPAKLISINERLAYIVLFDDHKTKLKASHNKLVEFSLSYPRSTNDVLAPLQGKNIMDISEDGSTCLVFSEMLKMPHISQKLVTKLQSSFSSVLTYIKNSAKAPHLNLLSTSSTLAASSADESGDAPVPGYVFKATSQDINMVNFRDYAIFSCIGDVHDQFPSYRLNMELKSKMELQDVENFSLRTKYIFEEDNLSSLATHAVLRYSNEDGGAIGDNSSLSAAIDHSVVVEKAAASSIRPAKSRKSQSNHNHNNNISSSSGNGIDETKMLIDEALAMTNSGKSYRKSSPPPTSKSHAPTPPHNGTNTNTNSRHFSTRVFHHSPTSISDSEHSSKRQKIDFNSYTARTNGKGGGNARMTVDGETRLVTAEYIKQLRNDFMQSIFQQVENFCFDILRLVTPGVNDDNNKNNSKTNSNGNSNCVEDSAFHVANHEMYNPHHDEDD